MMQKNTKTLTMLPQEADNPPPVLQVNRLSKNYGNGFQALKEVSFSINKGEIFGYIGPNGAGKTTTLKILVGLIRDFTGNVFLEQTALNESDKIKNKENTRPFHQVLGYLPQDCGFQEWRTIDHVLSTFGKLSGMSDQRIEQRTTEILTLLGLLEVRHKKIVHLSGGMIQKLRLAQAILHEPQILILDEPMNGLDPTSRYQMKMIIKRLAAEGTTILLSSHILSDIQDIATKIGILNRGQLVEYGSPQELQEKYQLGKVLEFDTKDKQNKVELAQLCTMLKPNIAKIEDQGQRKLLLFLNPDLELDTNIASILRTILEKKIQIRAFSLQQPSLEQVYIKLITKSLEHNQTFLASPEYQMNNPEAE